MKLSLKKKPNITTTNTINKDIEGEEGASKQIAREVYALMKSDNREGSISNILNNKEVLEEQSNPEMSDEDMLEKRMQETCLSIN